MSDPRAVVPSHGPALATLPEKRPLIVLPEPALLHVVARHNPFTFATTRLTMTAGATIAEIIAETGLDPRWYPHLRVWVGDRVVRPEAWGRARPKAGMSVCIVVAPMGGEGGGQKNTGMIIGQILITILAAVATVLTYGALSPTLIAALGSTAGGFAAGVAAAAVGAAITVGGQLLLNAIVPIQQPRLDAMSQPDALGASQTYSLQGARNQMAIGRPVPKVLGWHRMTPPVHA